MFNITNHQKVKVKSLSRSCPTLCDPVDCSLPGSSVQGILQARILEWVAISFANKNHNKIVLILHTLQDDCYQKEQKTSFGADVKKLEPLEMQKWSSHYGSTMVGPPKNQTQNYQPAVSLLGDYILKKLKAGTGRQICTPMIIAALVTIAKKWKQPKYPSVDEWINKIWYTMEYYSDLKTKDILTHATIWMNLEDIMLKGRSQTQKAKYW